jgi:lantibiotic modifying enzyme
LGEKILMKENNYYDNIEGNWKDLREENTYASYWCHGSGGIALARTKICNIQGNSHYKEDIIKAVENIKRCGFQRSKIYNHSLCHGNFGNIDILFRGNKRNL